jgi:arsenite methyltransferase
LRQRTFYANFAWSHARPVTGLMASGVAAVLEGVLPVGNDRSVRSSSGHELSDSSYLDSHFEAMKPEYEAMVRSVGIQRGWRVLDAGCGGGSFLELLAELVGPGGEVVAYDIDPENVEVVESRVVRGEFGCPIEARVGNLTTLPFPDDSFDAIWCANSSQYLTDHELGETLSEFRRVTCPLGLVAVKELDLTFNFYSPIDPPVLWRLYDAVRSHSASIRGVIRTPQLPIWFRRAGLMNVRFESFLSVRRAPLRRVEREFITSILQFQAHGAENVDIPEQDRMVWRKIADADALDRILDRPDFYYREGHILVVGEAPES